MTIHFMIGCMTCHFGQVTEHQISKAAVMPGQWLVLHVIQTVPVLRMLLFTEQGPNDQQPRQTAASQQTPSMQDAEVRAQAAMLVEAIEDSLLEV